ncbi:MAG: hypothetical protein PHF20_01490 [Halothiobacillaceae bacterium]|nr:hypothetical protein [Halothiobacillaceae bacterium]
MLVLIVDTGELTELTHINPETNRDMVLDVFMQTGRMREFFYFDPHHLRYLCTEETFEWCLSLIEEFEAQEK